MQNPEYAALFQRMYRDPGNLDVTFRFAEVSTQLGDYEAAIGALERVLLFNPNLPRVRLQLGVLYFKLGAYRVARSYLEQAAGSRGAPPEVQNEASQFIAEIDRRLSPTKFSLFAHTGLRYQSNANAGPSNSLIRSSGIDVALNDQFARRPDWNWFGLVGADYSYDPQLGNGLTFEAGAFGYYAKQFSQTRFDLGLFEFQAGPRFSLQSITGLSVKPYVIGTVSTLDSHLYFSGPGAGLSARVFASESLRIEPYIEYRHRVFKGSPNFANSFHQSGDLVTVGVAGGGVLLNRLQWFGRVVHDRNRTSEGLYSFNNYDRWAVDLGFPVALHPLWQGTRQFVLTPTVGFGSVSYRQPNPGVDPNTRREDRNWYAGLMMDAQIYRLYGIRAQVLYHRTTSNLPNFDMRNVSVIVGPTMRF